MKVEIRKERPDEYFQTEDMVRRSFYNKYVSGCNEHLLVHKLRNASVYLEEFSRVAVIDGEVAGTIMYFLAKVVAEDRVIEVPSFGPLCVEHKYKNHGIGKMLLQETLPLVKEAGYPGVIIVGEPDYYPKYGFVRAGDLGLTDAAGNVYDPFMALEFTPGALTIPGGRFVDPEEICDLPDAELAVFDKAFGYLTKAIRPCQWTYSNPIDEKNGYHLEYAMKYPGEFNRMFVDYVRKDLSQYNEMLKDYKVSKITDRIWASVNDAAYVIRVGEDFAGLLVTAVPTEEIGEGDCASYIQELYVCPKYRNRGIARDIFFSFIEQQKQDTGFWMVPESLSGIYWRRLLDEAGYQYDISREDDLHVFCHVYVKK